MTLNGGRRGSASVACIATWLRVGPQLLRSGARQADNSLPTLMLEASVIRFLVGQFAEKHLLERSHSALDRGPSGRCEER
jgi:hypothetical protein